MGVPVSQAEVVSAPSGTGTTIAITLPSHQEDDVLIVQVGWKGNQAPQTLTGWNLHFSNATGTATNGCGQGIWWRRVNPSETVSNPTLTIGTTAVERRAIAYCIRGADIDNPANTFWQKQQSVGNSATPTPAGVTTLAPNYLLLHLVTCRGNSAITPPTGYNEEQDSAEGTTICVEGSTKTQATAATVSGQAASISSNRWVAAIIAIPSPDYCYFRAQTSTTATGTSVTGTLPTNTTQTDFYDRADGMLAIVKAAGSGISITADAAWTNVANWDLDTSSGSDSIEVFAAEFATGRNLQFTRSGSGNIAVQLLTYRNIHQTAFIGNSSARQNAGTPAVMDATSRGNTKSTMIGVIACDADTNGVNTAPAGYTERSDGLGIATCDQVFEAGGSTTSANWTTTNAANVAGMIEILSHAGAAAFATLERSASLSATADITSAAESFSVFSRTAAIDGSASVVSNGEFFSVFSASAAIDTTATVTIAGMTEQQRNALLAATAALEVSGTRIIDRSTALSAVATIESLGESFTLFESAVILSATVGIESSAASFSVFEGAVSINLAASVETAGVRIVERSSSLTATAAVESNAIFFSVVSSAAQIDASAAIQTSAEFFSIFERQSSINTAAVITVIRQVESMRSVTFSTVADIAVSGGIEGGVFEHERSAAIDATGGIQSSAISFSIIERTSEISASGSVVASGFTVRERSALISASGVVAVTIQRDLQRSVSIDTTAGIDSSGGVPSTEPVERAATISVIAGISVSVTFQHPTPPRRTFVVSSERRTVTVSPERRVYVVPVEDREEVVV